MAEKVVDVGFSLELEKSTSDSGGFAESRSLATYFMFYNGDSTSPRELLELRRDLVRFN